MNLNLRGNINKLFDWLDRYMRFPEDKEPQPSFNGALLEIASFDKYAKSQVCPACHKKDGFKVKKFERGNKGWELSVACSCGFSGTVNTTGFRFEKATA